jgi:SAM-dependent methyltransferase
MGVRDKRAFTWQSGAGHAVRLVETLRLEPGVVFDLGCGYGVAAEALAERGFTYIGCDNHQAGLDDLEARGFETMRLDLQEADLAEELDKRRGDRPVSLVMLLDVLAQVAPPEPVLDAVWGAVDQLGGPVLLVSVHNVTHTDVASKMVFGRFDYTATGLLDERNVSHFDANRLQVATEAAGFREVGRRDFELPLSDQRFPRDHPAMADATPVGQHLRHLRSLADDSAATLEFVRAYLPVQRSSLEGSPAPAITAPEPEPGRFLTVVMRTQLRRPENLREALTCLAGQIDDDFDVSLMVHHQDPSVAAATFAIVDEFHQTFAGRVSVIPVLAGGRSRPLNEALERLRSDYVAFLDDDDLVTADWVSSFRDAADGVRIARTWTAERPITEVEGDLAPYDIVGSLDLRWAVGFDLAQHLWQNHSPICSWAVPRSAIEAANLRFSEQVDVIEDWHFLIRCASLVGVRDLPRVTSIYHRWVSGESSTSLHREATWRATQHLLLDQLDRDPLLLPRGSASQLADLWERVHLDTDATEASSTELDALRNEIDAMRRSRWWRLTRPAARAFSRVRPHLAWMRSSRGGSRDAAG